MAQNTADYPSISKNIAKYSAINYISPKEKANLRQIKSNNIIPNKNVSDP
jgi:hypothetical protein